MKLLFLNPPSLTAENVVRDSIYGCWCKGKRIAGAMTPPHPIVVLATLMRDEGHEVRVIDAMAEENLGFADVERIVAEYDFLILLTSVMTFNEDREILALLKKANPELKTIIYGALPTFLPEFALQADSVDFIIRREAEFVLRDFMRYRREDDERWKQVQGLGYRQIDGTPVVNDYYPFIENLDEIPHADWSLLNNSNRYFNPSVRRYPYVTDLTTRGCPSRCIYCMSPGFYGNKVRGRSAGHVLEGFRLAAAKGYQEIYLRDEMFTTFRKRNAEIYQAMIAEQLDLTWLCSVKVGTVSREDIEQMRTAGCHTLKIGVETGVQTILDTLQKGIQLGQTRELFKWCNELGMDTHAHLMIGNPDETPETIRQTIDFVLQINPTTVTFGILTPYPGTPLFDRVLAKHPELKDGYDLRLEDLHLHGYYSDAYCDMTAQELGEWSRRAHRAFYLRPRYIASWLRRIRSWDDLKRIGRAGWKVADYALRGE